MKRPENFPLYNLKEKKMKRLVYLSVLLSALLFVVGCGSGFAENGVYPSNKQMVQEAKKDITEITYDSLIVKLNNKELRLVIDIREPFEFEEGFINQADEETDEFPYPESFTVNVPRGSLEFMIDSKKYWDDDLMVDMPPKDELIVVYCLSGGRSALAAQTLMRMGYTNVKSLRGGYKKWLDPSWVVVDEVETDDGG
jgi:rhodanese-related sulfurtransferase